tara:strand:+ start:2276 stop:3586 length:1311 start_codon:yes stop_codon:yes gene_type:complete
MFRNLTKSIQNWKKPLLEFLSGQSGLQVINMATGFFLLRWMSVEHYAQFGVAFAFQATLTMLSDLGFSSAILALAGERSKQPEVLGRYLKSAIRFRTLLFVIAGCSFALLFPFITAGQPWSPKSKALILGSILCSVAVQGWMMYQAPLLTHRRIASFYRPQIVSSGIRLAASWLLHLLSGLSGVAASWVSTLTLAISSRWIKSLGAPLVSKPEKCAPEANREMLRYLAPLMPGVAFSALQSQILIAIITIFGSTQSIAEVSALGRLGQLFAVLNAFNGAIIAPYFSALPGIRLHSMYFKIVAAAAVVGGTLTLLSFLFPQPLLWLLGPKYADLENAIGWMVLASCLSYLGSVMWSIHSARKWIFWWGTAVYIGLLLVTQVSSAAFLDLSSTMGVIYFGVATSMAIMVVHLCTATYGLTRPITKSPEKAQDNTPRPL